MADLGKYIGDFEYGKVPYAGCYVGDMEYGRCPGIGYTYVPPPPPAEVGGGVEMLNVKIPKNIYTTAAYEHLEERAIGLPIPEWYGEVHNIRPVCIDTTLLKYKLAKRAIKSIDKIVADGATLSAGDYTEDLANAEFTLKCTPKITKGVTYYIVVEAAFAINGSNYLMLCGKENAYADGNVFEIDGGGAWNPTLYDLCMKIYGRETLEGGDSCLVDFPGEDWSGWGWQKFRDAAARTRIAMSFKVPGSGEVYITRVNFFYTTVGNPTGYVYLKILSAYNPSEVQVGSTSGPVGNAPIENGWTDQTPADWPIRGAGSEILVDGKGYKNPDSSLMDNVSDILQDVLKIIIGVKDSQLDAAAFAALKLARAEPKSIYLDKEGEFDEFITTMEAGDLFKFVPQLDGTFAPIYYAAGEPAGTPHFMDEDFLSFEMYRDFKRVKYRVKCKYFKNPTSQEWPYVENTSKVARYCYKNEETLEVESFHKNSSGASAAVTSYLGMLESPGRYAIFTVGPRAFDRIMTNKVKLTRSRADYPGGSLNGVLFRIMKITKAMSMSTCQITAVLDAQTY